MLSSERGAKTSRTSTNTLSLNPRRVSRAGSLAGGEVADEVRERRRHGSSMLTTRDVARAEPSRLGVEIRRLGAGISPTASLTRNHAPRREGGLASDTRMPLTRHDDPSFGEWHSPFIRPMFRTSTRGRIGTRSDWWCLAGWRPSTPAPTTGTSAAHVDGPELSGTAGSRIGGSSSAVWLTRPWPWVSMSG